MILATFESKVDGIPCKIEVTHFLSVPPHKGSPHSCDCPDDYYGYTEVEFRCLDRRGRRAAWLERKLTQAEIRRIETECAEHMSQEGNI